MDSLQELKVSELKTKLKVMDEALPEGVNFTSFNVLNATYFIVLYFYSTDLKQKAKGLRLIHSLLKYQNMCQEYYLSCNELMDLAIDLNQEYSEQVAYKFDVALANVLFFACCIE